MNGFAYRKCHTFGRGAYSVCTMVRTVLTLGSSERYKINGIY